MPNMAAVVRKMVVLRHIEKLPPEEKERARLLFQILDKIEWYTIFPFYLSILFVPVPLYFYVKEIIVFSDVGAILSVVFAYLAGILILKVLVRPLLTSKTDELRKRLSDSRNRSALETLRRLDPDMSRNIRRHIERAIPTR